MGCDLENLFGTLRREESRRSDATALLDDDVDDVDEVDDDVDIAMKKKRKPSPFDSMVVSNTNGGIDNDDIQIKKKRKPSPLDSLLDIRHSQPDDPVRMARKRKASDTFDDLVDDHADDNINNTEDHKAKKARKILTAKRNRTKNSKPVNINVGKIIIPKTSNHNSTVEMSEKREKVTAKSFRYESLAWSTWKLAAGPRNNKTVRGDWKTLNSCGNNTIVWKRDLLDDCAVKSAKSMRNAMLFEVSVTTPTNHRRKVVACRFSQAARNCGPHSTFQLPWYRGLFRSVKNELRQAAQANCRVYVRWAKIPARNFGVWSSMTRAYDYAWNNQRHAFKGKEF